MFSSSRRNVKGRLHRSLRRGHYNTEPKSIVSPNQLHLYEHKIKSQFGEDGIIQEIFRRIGTTNRLCVEFGGYDGIAMSNTANLIMNHGWHGVFIEGSSKFCQQARSNYHKLGLEAKVSVYNNFITRENIAAIFKAAKIPKEFDFLSIDLDGNDYYVWQALAMYRPRVLVIEYNASYPPPLKWIRPYDPNFAWDGSNNYGASLNKFEELGKSMGYCLLGTEHMGCNAFFIRKDQLLRSGFKELTAREAYNTPKYGTHIDGGHPPAGPGVQSPYQKR
ncbi:MAG: hypothetical protein RLZ12_174 [Bacillota bacterium]